MRSSVRSNVPPPMPTSGGRALAHISPEPLTLTIEVHSRPAMLRPTALPATHQRARGPAPLPMGPTPQARSRVVPVKPESLPKAQASKTAPFRPDPVHALEAPRPAPLEPASIRRPQGPRVAPLSPAPVQLPTDARVAPPAPSPMALERPAAPALIPVRLSTTARSLEPLAPIMPRRSSAPSRPSPHRLEWAQGPTVIVAAPRDNPKQLSATVVILDARRRVR